MRFEYSQQLSENSG